MSLYARVFSESAEQDPMSHRTFKALYNGSRRGDVTDTPSSKHGDGHIPESVLRQAHAQGLIKLHTINGPRRGFHTWHKLDESVLGAIGTAALAGGAAAAGVKTYRALRGAMDRRKQAQQAQQQAQQEYSSKKAALDRAVTSASDRIKPRPQPQAARPERPAPVGFKKPTLRMYSAN